MAKTLPLSISVIAKNEATNLRRCLKSLVGLPQEIIVVHNDCTDETVKVAQEFGATCIEQDWLGYRDQKNFSLNQCTMEWILSLDADEALSEQLKKSIETFISSPQLNEQINGASFNRCSFFMGKWIRHGDWYPDKKIRLVRNGHGKWVGGSLHESLDVEGKTRYLKGDLQHYSYDSIRSFPEKAIKFSDIFLDSKVSSGARMHPHDAWLRPIWRFFRAYVLRFGFLDGYAGFFIAFSTAYETMLRHGRLWERDHVETK